LGSLRQVPPLAVLHEWPRVAPLIREALERGEGSYLEADVAMACMGGLWGLWLVERDGQVAALCVSEIINFPRKKKCLLRYLAGDWETIEAHIPDIEAYARAQGCHMLEGYARRGWARRMGDWEQRYVILQKELVDA
jgi:hypothetical protein